MKAHKLFFTIVRIVLGVDLFVNGLAYFVVQFRVPDGTPPLAATLAQAMLDTGYFFELVKAVELLTGIALLSNRFVPLALVVVAPVVVNIVLFDVLLSPNAFSLSMGLSLAVLYVITVVAYYKYLSPILIFKTSQGGGA